MSTSLFARTVKTNIVLYKSNGDGRDTYISYNSGGFWKENIRPIVPKETFYRKPFSIYRSWGKTPPIWTYHSDGSGRDTYVCYNNGGLMKKFSSMAENYKNFLRLNDDNKKDESLKNIKINLSRDEKIYLRKIHKIQKDLVNRLYNSINNNKRSLRKKIICNDSYKLRDDNISFDLKNISENSKSLDLKEKYNTLMKSHSQVYNKKLHLQPIKSSKNRFLYNFSSLVKNKNKLMSNNNNMNSKSTHNIFRKSINIDNDVNNRNYFYRRKFIYDTLDNKFTKCPKVRCTIDLNEHKNK